MLARNAEPTIRFTRRDAGRLLLASILMVAAMSVILGLDFLPAQTQLEVGRPAPANVQAPRTTQYVSEVLTQRERDAARIAVEPQYDFTTARGAARRDPAAARAGHQRRAHRRSLRRRRDRGGSRRDPRGRRSRTALAPTSARRCSPSTPRAGRPSATRPRASSTPSSARSCATPRSPRSGAASQDRMAGGPDRSRGRAGGAPDLAPGRRQLVVLIAS